MSRIFGSLRDVRKGRGHKPGAPAPGGQQPPRRWRSGLVSPHLPLLSRRTGSSRPSTPLFLAGEQPVCQQKHRTKQQRLEPCRPGNSWTAAVPCQTVSGRPSLIWHIQLESHQTTTPCEKSGIWPPNNVPGSRMMEVNRGADPPRLSLISGAVMKQQPCANGHPPFPQASNPSRPSHTDTPPSHDSNAPQANASQSSAEQSQRDSQGRFTANNKGGPGNPFARRTAALRQAMLDAVTGEDLQAIVRQLIQQAQRRRRLGCPAGVLLHAGQARQGR